MDVREKCTFGGCFRVSSSSSPSMHSHVPPPWENAHHFELRSIAFAEEVVV